MFTLAATPEWTTPVVTALVLVLLAFAAFFARRAIELVLAVILGLLRGKSRSRHISAVGHREILRLLDGIRDSTKAFRVCVYQFHNGTQFFRANHMWKMSLTHESTHQGVAATHWRDANDLPIVAVMEFAGPMIDDDKPDRGVRMVQVPDHRAAYYNINNMPVCVFQALANSGGVRHAVALNLVDKVSGCSISILAAFFDELASQCPDGPCAADPPKCLEQHTGLRVCCLRMVDYFAKDMSAAADKIQFYLTTDFATFKRPDSFLARLLGS